MDARERVLDLVRWIDRREVFDLTGPEAQALARALVACAELVPQTPRTARTLDAARAFVASPVEERWFELSRAATDSYPFGPGDGCYSVDELGLPSCAPGSGCRSGAGTLASIAHTAGFEAVAAAIRDVLDDSQR